MAFTASMSCVIRRSFRTGGRRACRRSPSGPVAVGLGLVGEAFVGGGPAWSHELTVFTSRAEIKRSRYCHRETLSPIDAETIHLIFQYLNGPKRPAPVVSEGYRIIPTQWCLAASRSRRRRRG